MKIKRFTAPDMRAAFRLVREEHGADAVILSNRRTSEGIEIVAASNYDEELVQRALDTARGNIPAAPNNPAVAIAAPPVHQRATPTADAMIAALAGRQMAATHKHSPLRATDMASAARPQRPHPQTTAAPHVAQQICEDLPAPAPAGTAPAAWDRDDLLDKADVDLPDALPQIPPPAPLAATQPSGAAPSKAAPGPQRLSMPQNDEELKHLRGELALMRQMIEREMHRLTDERLRGSPVRAQALELMDDYGFDAGLTREIVLKIPAETELHRGRGLMLGLLSKRLPVTAADPLEQGGIIALIGPTGAGKTTTIAKLAQRFAAKHTPRDVALVTTDTLRVGGREQLQSYGRQLGIAVHEAGSGEDLTSVLEKLSDYKLVLIDTAGMGQRDRALAVQLHWLRNTRQITSLLVLPANAHFSDLDEVVRRFAQANPQGVVLTKLDETGRLGSVLSVVVDHQIPITWVADGQRVPDDLHRANAASLVLRLEDLRRAADKPCNPEYQHAVA